MIYPVISSMIYPNIYLVYDLPKRSSVLWSTQACNSFMIYPNTHRSISSTIYPDIHLPQHSSVLWLVLWSIQTLILSQGFKQEGERDEPWDWSWIQARGWSLQWRPTHGSRAKIIKTDLYSPSGNHTVWKQDLLCLQIIRNSPRHIQNIKNSKRRGRRLKKVKWWFLGSTAPKPFLSVQWFH